MCPRPEALARLVLHRVVTARAPVAAAIVGALIAASWLLGVRSEAPIGSRPLVLPAGPVRGGPLRLPGRPRLRHGGRVGRRAVAPRPRAPARRAGPGRLGSTPRLLRAHRRGDRAGDRPVAAAAARRPAARVGAQELRLALAHGEIEVFYQPVVNLHTGAIVGAEALAVAAPATGCDPPTPSSGSPRRPASSPNSAKWCCAPRAPTPRVGRCTTPRCASNSR